MVKSIDIVQETILHALLTYIHSLCLSFGRYITQTRVHFNILIIFRSYSILYRISLCEILF